MSLNNEIIKLKQINAYDEEERSIRKDVFLFKTSDDKWIVSFGNGWCRYYISSLFSERFYENLKREKPIDLCIDIMGRNHYGSPVYVKFDDLKKLYEMIKQKGIIK